MDLDSDLKRLNNRVAALEAAQAVASTPLPPAYEAPASATSAMDERLARIEEAVTDLAARITMLETPKADADDTSARLDDLEEQPSGDDLSDRVDVLEKKGTTSGKKRVHR